MAPVFSFASAVGAALATKTASVDIAKPREAGYFAGRDSFAAVTARAPPSMKQPKELPTPPNSISPSIPPQAYGRRVSSAPPTPPLPVHLDSDMDLQDAVDHANAQDRLHRGPIIKRETESVADMDTAATITPGPHRGLIVKRERESVEEDMDTAGAITPGLLAKHYLPGILLENGPLAIRHIMGYLTTSVPGFSGIPPAKARRVVVSALEGRAGDEPGEIDEDVRFEKVGWGKWDARRRRQPPGDARSVRPHQDSRTAHPTTTDHPIARPIPSPSRRPIRRRNIASGASGASEALSHKSEPDDFDPDVEKMCLDGNLRRPTPPGYRDLLTLSELEADTTVDEDWASIGPAELRRRYGPFTGFTVVRRRGSMHTARSRQDANANANMSAWKKKDKGSGSKTIKSGSRSSSPHVHRYPPHPHSDPPTTTTTTTRTTVHEGIGEGPAPPPLPDGDVGSSDTQEREAAAEALINMKSV